MRKKFKHEGGHGRKRLDDPPAKQLHQPVKAKPSVLAKYKIPAICIVAAVFSGIGTYAVVDNITQGQVSNSVLVEPTESAETTTTVSEATTSEPSGPEKVSWHGNLTCRQAFLRTSYLQSWTPYRYSDEWKTLSDTGSSIYYCTISLENEAGAVSSGIACWNLSKVHFHHNNVGPSAVTDTHIRKCLKDLKSEGKLIQDTQIPTTTTAPPPTTTQPKPPPTTTTKPPASTSYSYLPFPEDSPYLWECIEEDFLRWSSYGDVADLIQIHIASDCGDRYWWDIVPPAFSISLPACLLDAVNLINDVSEFSGTFNLAHKVAELFSFSWCEQVSYDSDNHGGLRGIWFKVKAG